MTKVKTRSTWLEACGRRPLCVELPGPLSGGVACLIGVVRGACMQMALVAFSFCAAWLLQQSWAATCSQARPSFCSMEGLQTGQYMLRHACADVLCQQCEKHGLVCGRHVDSLSAACLDICSTRLASCSYCSCRSTVCVQCLAHLAWCVFVLTMHEAYRCAA